MGENEFQFHRSMQKSPVKDAGTQYEEKVKLDEESKKSAPPASQKEDQNEKQSAKQEVGVQKDVQEEPLDKQSSKAPTEKESKKSAIDDRWVTSYQISYKSYRGAHTIKDMHQ